MQGLVALSLRRTDPNRCPRCTERVTPFAAGCALCGADLDPLRHRSGPGALQRIGSATTALHAGPRAAGRLRGWRSDGRQFAAVAFVAVFACAIVGTAVGLLALAVHLVTG